MTTIIEELLSANEDRGLDPLEKDALAERAKEPGIFRPLLEVISRTSETDSSLKEGTDAKET